MLKRMNYLWRLAATGGCFAVFGVGGFLLWTLVFPVVRALPGKTRAERVRWVIHKSFAAFMWLMESVGIMRFDVSGRERLANCRNVLVLANHPTLIDVVAMISLMPDASCVVKHALWKNPLLGGVVRGAGYISNSDSDRLVEECARDLHRGKPLIIFPEGTRSRPGQPLAFQRGAAYIALQSRIPILPVLIDCRPSTLTKRERWYQIPPSRFHLRIRVLEPTSAEQWVPTGEPRTIAARKLTRALERFFTSELMAWTH
ncbi:lysophospholipid acyltransferase family protein [Propionivibrio soli]|uniref:lysophospholipid acyltransferase family protein n=1 Tax=Propionivibrio soli TaxID=2976531 RepID=UPI0021E913CB